METPLSIFTKEEILGVILFFFEEGVKPVEIFRRIVYCAVKFTSG
jgi:hypothetical protein